jgi:NAD-dependent DNA ligase
MNSRQTVVEHEPNAFPLQPRGAVEQSRPESRVAQYEGTASGPTKLPQSQIANKKFVFSGILRHITRPKAELIVRENGGDVLKSVTSNTDFLVIGPHLKNGKPITMGNEYQKAASSSRRTVILTEEEFLKMIVPF